MTMTESHHTAEIPIPASENGEDFGEVIVAAFISHINSLRHAQGLSDLSVGSWSFLTHRA